MTLRVRRALALVAVAMLLFAAPLGAAVARAETVSPTPVATASATPAVATPVASAEPTDSVTPFEDTAPDVAPDNTRTLIALLGAGVVALAAAAVVFFRR